MPRTNAEYRRSLDDGRAIYLVGSRINGVGENPAFRNAIDSIANLYELQGRPENLERMTYQSPGSGTGGRPRQRGPCRCCGHLRRHPSHRQQQPTYMGRKSPWGRQIYASWGQQRFTLHTPALRSTGIQRIRPTKGLPRARRADYKTLAQNACWVVRGDPVAPSSKSVLMNHERHAGQAKVKICGPTGFNSSYFHHV